MADILQKTENLAVLAVLAGGLYLAYQVMRSDPLGGIGSWWDSLWQTGTDAPIETQTQWCESLGRNIDPALTCPTKLEPLVYPVHVPCDPGFYHGNDGVCIRIPGTEPIEAAPIERISDMCYFNGEPVLTVPPGMSCEQGLQDMCNRFGPGSRYCGMV